MGWTLDNQPLKQPDLLDELFRITGKALYFASAFEAKCRFIIRVINLTDYHEKGGDIFDTEAVTAVLKAKLLGKTIGDMSKFPDFDATDIEVLERAKDARNFVAHESANIGWPLSIVSARHIHEHLARLRQETEALAAGDNLMSLWVFKVQEKEPAPPGIQQAYPQWVQEWIFKTLDSGAIPEYAEDERTLAEKLHALCSPVGRPAK